MTKLTEQEQSSQETGIFQIETGQVFKPFEGLTLHPLDANADDLHDQTIMERNFQWKNQTYNLSLKCDAFYDSSGYKETPLGPVPYYVETNVADRSEEIHVYKAPLMMQLNAPTSSESEVLRNEHILVLKFGEKNYYFWMTGKDTSNTWDRVNDPLPELTQKLREIEISDGISTDNHLKPYPPTIYDTTSNRQVILPYDQERIQEIEAAIVHAPITLNRYNEMIETYKRWKEESRRD